MGISERKYRQREEVRAAILSSAWKMVKEEGWQALSIRKIAEAIEYSNPVIYSHFDNKEAILLEFTKEGFLNLKAKLQDAIQSVSSPAAQLEKMAHAYWDFAFENREFYQVMFGLGIPACETVNKIAEMKALTELMINTIGRAIEESSNTNADVFLKFKSYWSILHGLVTIQMMDKNSVSSAGNYEKVSDAIGGFIYTMAE